ncbi:MAG: helix-turn-helix transcriptional regulator, partial [Oscillospiraceae bacterium]
MEKEIIEAAQRIKALREILEISIKDMADYLDISIQEYMDLEDAKVDFSFTCLHKCAQKFGVDITD